MQDNDKCREGVAPVINEFMYTDEFNHNLKKLIPVYEQLADDDNEEIQSIIVKSISYENYWKNPYSGEFFSILVGSKAALANVDILFRAVEKYAIGVTSYQKQLSKLIENITSLVNSKKIDKFTYYDSSSLAKIIIKLYDEATDDEDSETVNQCLDMWDKLLSSDLNAISSVSDNLERGILN